jgi:hypothetical protein
MMSMSVVGWIVLGLMCWTVSGVIVGIVIGKAIKGRDENISSPPTA